MTLLLNIFDYFILLKYYNTFLGERRRFSRLFFGVASVGLIGLGICVNSFGEPFCNLMVTFIILISASFFYNEKLLNKFIIVIGYLGFSMISEVFIIGVIGNKEIMLNALIGSISILTCQLFKLCLIMTVSTFKREKNQKLPGGAGSIITVMFIITTAGCIIVNWTSVYEKRNDYVLGNLIIVIFFLSTYLLLFVLLDKFNEAARLNYEQNMMIQESKLKESYYREIDNNNLKLRKISHDFKNQLLPLIDINEKDLETAKITIQQLLDDICNIEGEIFTKNNVLNSICKIKFGKAKAKSIKISYEINLPDTINISYGDMGIIFGNILDNAIEACEKVEVQLRYINLKVELYNDCLLIKMTNSKSIESIVEKGFKTSKKDKENHGFGMKSVQDIIEKYNGILELEDLKDKIEINIILWGIVKMN